MATRYCRTQADTLDFKPLRGHKFKNNWGQIVNLRALAERDSWAQTDIDRLTALELNDSAQLGNPAVNLRRFK